MSGSERECIHGRMTKGIKNCHKKATHTGGYRYPGPVCEDHAVEGSEPMDRSLHTGSEHDDPHEIGGGGN